MPTVFRGLRKLHLQPDTLDCLEPYTHKEVITYSAFSMINPMEWLTMRYTLSSPKAVASRTNIRQVFELPKLRYLRLECRNGERFVKDMESCSKEDIFVALISIAREEASEKLKIFELHYDYYDGS